MKNKEGKVYLRTSVQHIAPIEESISGFFN